MCASLHGLAAGAAVGGFLGIVFYKTKKINRVGEVSANSQIAVKSVTHERIQHQQLGTFSLFFFLLWMENTCAMVHVKCLLN